MKMVTVDVQVACDERGIPSAADIHNWIEAAVMQSGRLTKENAEVAVRVVDAVEIQTLNRRYREQDKPTNVLSFPADGVSGLPDDASQLLGDVVVCASIVSTEAAEQGKALADHWGHMLVHGTLHLLGFDHGTDVEALEMEHLETKILASQNVTNPYSES
jgi:probable rRNA maturation factor